MRYALSSSRGRASLTIGSSDKHYIRARDSRRLTTIGLAVLPDGHLPRPGTKLRRDVLQVSQASIDVAQRRPKHLNIVGLFYILS